ncbi:MAG: DEAD/DEAH box helicase [Bacteroidota bacterium]
MSFELFNLNKPLANAISDMGFTEATAIQLEAYPAILTGKDVVAIAPTGTGKTIAYLMPIIKLLKYSEQKHPRILIVAPTRELVLQTVGEINALTKYANIRCAGVYGGTSMKTQKQVVYDGLDILVATPGRLFDLQLSGVLRLQSIQKLIIDEVDEMLNLGFRHQMISFMDSLPQKRQNIMVSATLSEEVEEIISQYFEEPIWVDTTISGVSTDRIEQSFYQVQNYHTKVNLLKNLLFTNEDMQRVIVFVGSRKMADKLHTQLCVLFPDEIGVIHSNRSQNQRINALVKFEEGLHRVLVSTDIAARGIDILDVTHVINFDTPQVPGNYIHRIGRTARAEKTGIATMFVAPNEMVHKEKIELLLNKKLIEIPFPEDVDISDKLSKEEVSTPYDKDYLKQKPLEKKNGAFHEKKDKNKKVNLGGPGKKKDMKGLPSKRGSKKK